MRPARSVLLSVFGLGALIVLAGCGELADTSPAAPGTQSSTTTIAADVVPSTTVSTDTTYPIEVVIFAEQYGASPEEADALLAGQTAQYQAMDQLYELVGQDIIVTTAFGDYPRIDELTILVVDEESVALVEARLTEAGLDQAKTFVEVAPEEAPYDPWDWLEGESYAGYEWLESPGPHLSGAWELVESNGVAPEVPLLAGFGPRWSLEACSSWLGPVVTSAEGWVTLTVDEANLDCGEATEAIEELVFSVIAENGGEFEVLSRGEDAMAWQSSAGDTLVWEQPEEFIEFTFPVYPANRSEIHKAWVRSLAPEMEGVWYLQEVGNEEPAAPVSINVGVSTIGFEGQCNSMEGMFVLSTDHQLGIRLAGTQAFCSGPKGEVEDQLNNLLSEHGAMLDVSIEDDMMTWSTETGPQMIWSR